MIINSINSKISMFDKFYYEESKCEYFNKNGLCRKEKNMRKKNIKTVAGILCASALAVTLSGCGAKNTDGNKPSIHLASYTKMEYETTTTKQGDISPVLELFLAPDEYETKNYKIEQDDFEVEAVNVAEGDKVSAGDVMIQFKADEIQETIDEYTEEMEEAELLIEHYQKLSQIEGTDYSDDIADLREDIEIAQIYIEEQNERYKDYQVIAERDGTVIFINEWLEYGYVSSSDILVTVASGSSNYTATTDDDYEFTIGDIYEAEYDVAKYEMKVISVNKYEDAATGKEMQTIIFEPVTDTTGVSVTDELEMTINKPVIENVVYVDKDAICEIDEGEYFVYVLSEDGYRTAVNVTIGETIDGYTIIESGLTAGEQVTIN